MGKGDAVLEVKREIPDEAAGPRNRTLLAPGGRASGGYYAPAK